LDDAAEERLAEHLAGCGGCRQELERLAGSSQDWSSVRDSLRRETACTAAVESESDTDFAVHFLEPSSSSDSLGWLGDVEIHEVLGRGGMGIVLKGYQPELKRLVAVKVLAPHLAVSGPARKRFAREAEAVAAILHPNVMPILSVHSSGRLPYLVMPYLACESLQQRIARVGPLELVDVLRIGLQTAQGLAAAHAQGLIHRDVKPENILLERGVDRVMLTDFGLARAIDDASLTRTGLIAGTPQFMSPEQARGEPLDARSDLFSLGSVLYTMAAGRPPFRAETTYGLLRRIIEDTPRPLRDVNGHAPEWLARIIDRLLAKSPAQRFPSAAELAGVLEQCLAHVQHPGSAPLPDFCRPRSRDWRWARPLVATALLALATTLFVLRPGSPPAPPTPSKSSSTKPADWDPSAAELEQLTQDGIRFEAEVEAFWDRSTLPSQELP
jgi:serine/threonine-protein kinase